MNGPIGLSSIAGDKDVFRFRWSTLSQAEGRGSNPALLSTCPQQVPRGSKQTTPHIASPSTLPRGIFLYHADADRGL